MGHIPDVVAPLGISREQRQWGEMHVGRDSLRTEGFHQCIAVRLPNTGQADDVEVVGTAASLVLALGPLNLL